MHPDCAPLAPCVVQADDATLKSLLGKVVELQVWEAAHDVVRAQVRLRLHICLVVEACHR